MTLVELNEHLNLVEKLAKAEENLQALKDAAYPGAAVITGMPHTPGIKDKVGDLGTEIADMDARITFLEEKIKKSELRILPFIQSIEDDTTRLVFRLRFLRGLHWKEVAVVLRGNNTESGVKQMCYRYLEDAECCSVM